MSTDRSHAVAVAYDCLFPYTTGGGERQYRAFAAEMARRGRDVTYLTSAQWPAGTVPDAPFRVEAVCPPLRLYDTAGVRRTAAALRFAWALWAALRRRRRRYGAVLVSGLPVLNVFAARAALWGSGTTLAVDYLEVWGRRQWREYAGPLTGTLAWALQRAAIALTPIATCHSALTARRLRAEGFRGTLVQSPGLIDARPDDADTPAPGAAGAPPVALYVGRHIPDKRVEALPAAVAAARRRIPDLRLVILGEGPSSPQVQDAVDAADGAEWTDLPGFVPEEELRRLLDGAACLVHPSRREGYGLVVVEAAAHGTPVVLVADEGNAATELVAEGVNGTVAASADPDDLGEAIARVVAAGGELRRSTHAWYRVAVRERTISRTVEGILTALDGAGVGTPHDAQTEEGHP